jgi:hypothetical protein
MKAQRGLNFLKEVFHLRLYVGKFADLRLADWHTKENCGCAISGLIIKFADYRFGD